MPPLEQPNYDLVLLLGPGVLICLAAVLIYWLRSRKPPEGPRT